MRALSAATPGRRAVGAPVAARAFPLRFGRLPRRPRGRDRAENPDPLERFTPRTAAASPTDTRELAELVAELERAEAFEQRLRQVIVEARDQLAAGNTSVALSMLNAALNDIDAATDVVAPTPASSPRSTGKTGTR